jgi:hypothetical protein
MNSKLRHEPDAAERVVLRARHCPQKHLGEWTTARRLAVEAADSLVVVDLLLPRIPSGDIEIDLDIDHSTVKLLAPADAQIDDSELRRIGPGRVKDRTGTSSPTGRRILLKGEMRSSEVRVHRGGVALLSLLPRHQREVRRAHQDGRLEPSVASTRGGDVR